MTGFLGRFLHLWAGLTAGWGVDAWQGGHSHAAAWLALSAVCGVFMGDVFLRVWKRRR